MKKVICVAGTRPEAIKMAPVMKVLAKINDIEMKFVWSGQHYDYKMSKIFFKELDLPEPHIDLKIGSGTHAQQTAKIMLALDNLLKRYRPDMIIAEGDTNTVAAASLTAIKEKIPFAHVEAGLRSYDRNMPEEINRCVAGVCAELHFAPTKNAAANLVYEGVPLHRIHVTGNTIVDVIKLCINSKRQKQLAKKFSIGNGKSALLTLHRAENVDDVNNLRTIVKAITSLNEIKIIFPIHPRTVKQLKKFGLYEQLASVNNIILTEPLGYLDFLNLMCIIDCVLTDSGGVQEEAFMMQLPTITLRYNTERPETVWYGRNVLVGMKGDMLVKAVRNIGRRRIRKLKIPNEIGDGNAGKQIAGIIHNYLNNRRTRSLNLMKGGSAIHRVVMVKRPIRISEIPANVWITAIYDRNGEPLIPSKNLRVEDGYVIRLFGTRKDVTNAMKILR